MLHKYTHTHTTSCYLLFRKQWRKKITTNNKPKRNSILYCYKGFVSIKLNDFYVTDEVKEYINREIECDRARDNVKSCVE